MTALESSLRSTNLRYLARKKMKQNYFFKNINCLYPQISQPKLNQIKHVWGVSESSWWADFKTAIALGFKFDDDLIEKKWKTGFAK